MVRVLLASDPCHWQRLLESMTAEQLQRWCCQNCVVEFVALAYCMYFILELSKLRTSQKSVLKACTKSQSVHSHTCIGTAPMLSPFEGDVINYYAIPCQVNGACVGTGGVYSQGQVLYAISLQR